MIDFMQNVIVKFFTIIFDNIPKDNMGDMITYLIFISLFFELFMVLFKRIINNAMKKII